MNSSKISFRLFLMVVLALLNRQTRADEPRTELPFTGVKVISKDLEDLSAMLNGADNAPRLDRVFDELEKNYELKIIVVDGAADRSQNGKKNWPLLARNEDLIERPLADGLFEFTFSTKNKRPLKFVEAPAGIFLGQENQNSDRELRIILGRDAGHLELAVIIAEQLLEEAKATEREEEKLPRQRVPPVRVDDEETKILRKLRSEMDRLDILSLVLTHFKLDEAEKREALRLFRMHMGRLDYQRFNLSWQVRELEKRNHQRGPERLPRDQTSHLVALSDLNDQIQRDYSEQEKWWRQQVEQAALIERELLPAAGENSEVRFFDPLIINHGEYVTDSEPKTGDTVYRLEPIISGDGVVHLLVQQFRWRNPIRDRYNPYVHFLRCESEDVCSNNNRDFPRYVREMKAHSFWSHGLGSADGDFYLKNSLKKSLGKKDDKKITLQTGTYLGPPAANGRQLKELEVIPTYNDQGLIEYIVVWPALANGEKERDMVGFISHPLARQRIEGVWYATSTAKRFYGSFKIEKDKPTEFSFITPDKIFEMKIKPN